jgi:uncharacterized coiled-coil protein SlyX
MIHSSEDRIISLEDFQQVHINRLNRRVAVQQARIAELERQLQDKSDYRTLIRFPTSESE